MSIWWGGIVGGSACVGAGLAWAGTRPRDLRARVFPLVHGPHGRYNERRPSRTAEVLSALARPPMRALDALFGARHAATRLTQAGLDWPVERFRLEQLRWAVGGMSVGAALGLVRAVSGSALSPVAWLLLVLLAGAVGACLAEQRLAQHAQRRRRLIELELPSAAELLAFTVAAGLSPGAALGRVAQRSQGALGEELRRCCNEVAAGVPLTEALRELAPRTGVASVGRFADTLVIALERGTPLADVLRAQALDARAAGHRALMESAGRREIAALMPVVFLILPVVVVMAVFPGLYGMTFHVP